jgi:hypothetical protein
MQSKIKKKKKKKRPGPYTAPHTEPDTGIFQGLLTVFENRAGSATVPRVASRSHMLFP